MTKANENKIDKDMLNTLLEKKRDFKYHSW